MVKKSKLVTILVVPQIFFSAMVIESAMISVDPKVDFADDKNNEQVPPKIQGVRVIVDAKQLSGGGSGSRDDQAETIHIKTSEGKQTVGIHTDITFEVDDKKNDTIKTDGRNAESTEDDNEVPIYRGTNDGTDRNNFDRRYDGSGYRANRPGFNGDETIHYDGTGTWISFVPKNNGWTTERYGVHELRPKSRGEQPGFVPYDINRRGFRPCYCADDESNWRMVEITRRSYGLPPRHAATVDDKLEYPFTETN